MRLGSRARYWGAFPSFLLMAGALTLGASGCLSEDDFAADEPDEEEPAAALLVEDECTPADVTFTPASSETQACAGPWTYNSYDVATSRDPLCGPQSCTLYKSCTRWLPQTPSTPSLNFNLNHLGCHLVEGEGLVCTPNWAEAQATCENFRIQKRNEIEAPADQRVTSATVSTQLVTPYPYTTQPNAFKCFATINWEKSSTGRHVDCGCETMEYPLCTHRIGTPKRRITPVGKTKAWVKQSHDETPVGQYTDNQIGAACTSGEDVPATNLALKLDRILNSLADPAIVPPGDSARVAEYVRRAKVTYELFSNSDVASPLARHADALNLYQGGPGYWEIEPTCGLNKPVTQQCPSGDESPLQFCTRLTSAHVKVIPGYGELLWRYYEPLCNELLSEIAQEIIAGDCNLDDDFTIATIDTHRRLHEKLLLWMGHGLDRSASGNNTAVIARTLNALDDWYASAEYMFSFGDTDQARAELDLVANKFWQVAYGHQPIAGEQAWLEQSPYAELQAALGEAEAAPADAVVILQGALEDTDTRGLKLDRDVLTAAYATVGTEPALRGAPLLHFTSGALEALVDRLEALGQFHDVGCSLADCAASSTPTKLSRFWKILAHLGTAPGSAPDLGDVLAATPGTLVGWMPAFLAVDGAQQRLLDAIAAARESGSPDEVSATIAQAQARNASYAATGMFLPAVGNRLYTGVHADQRTRVKDHLTSLNNTLTTSRTSIETRLVQLVDGLVRVRDGETSLEQLEAAKTRLRNERDDLNKRDAAFRKLIATGGEDPAFEELMAGWSQVVGAIDEEAYLRVGDSTDLFLTGQNATFDGWVGQTIAQVGAHKVEVPAGQAVSIATDGQWAPSCALRDVRMIDPGQEGAEAQAIDPTGVVTGPEGYSVTWTGSSFEATSEQSSLTGRLTAGVRVEGCSNTPGEPLLGGLHVCTYVDASVTGEQGHNWQNGTEGSTSAQFSSGIFLPTTPFEAPAGALVVVEMPPGVTDPSAIRDVHLIHGPHTTLVVDEAADLWFAVNDIDCSNQDGSKELHVKVATYLSVGDTAEALVSRMAHTLSLVRERRAGLLARGEILPSEATEIELQAKLDQIGGPGEPQIAVDDYPSPMRDLFYKYLAREMKLLEAEIRAAAIGRELEIKKDEYEAAQVAVKNSAMSGYLLSLLPKWSARGLHFKELRNITSVYAKDVRYYMGPLLRVWYPDVLEELEAFPALQELTSVDVDTPILAISTSLIALGDKVALEIARAEVPYPSPQDTAPAFVALRFPHPSVMDPACADSPSARCPRQGHGTTFRWATVAQSEALWSALGQPGDEQTSRRLIFQPTPDDLYQLLAGTHYLSCTKSLPVVRKVGLALTGFTTGQLPPEQRAIEGHIPDTAPMGFTDGAGVREFQLENPSWHHLATVPLIYGANEYNDVRDDFTAFVQDVRGVSPFTTFVFDLPESVVAEWNLRGARTIDLILELEAVRGNDIVAVPVCTAAP